MIHGLRLQYWEVLHKSYFYKPEPLYKNYLTGPASVSLLQTHNGQIAQQIGIGYEKAKPWLTVVTPKIQHACCLSLIQTESESLETLFFL